MIDNNEMIKVKNRGFCSTGYEIPDLGNLRRNFQPNEEKEVPMIELKKLSYLPGGKYILENCLIIENTDAINELINEVQPEYWYTDEDIKKLLTEGTLDEFLDCLDFAPEGVIESIKKIAVQIRLNDVSKRKAIKDKTDFDVTKAIEIEEISKEDEAKETDKPARRAAAPKIDNDAKKERRVTKIITTKE